MYNSAALCKSPKVRGHLCGGRTYLSTTSRSLHVGPVPTLILQSDRLASVWNLGAMLRYSLVFWDFRCGNSLPQSQELQFSWEIGFNDNLPDSESYSTIYVILCNTQGSWETQVLLPLVSPAGLSYLLKLLDACLWLIINNQYNHGQSWVSLPSGESLCHWLSANFYPQKSQFFTGSELLFSRFTTKPQKMYEKGC